MDAKLETKDLFLLYGAAVAGAISIIWLYKIQEEIDYVSDEFYKLQHAVVGDLLTRGSK